MKRYFYTSTATPSLACNGDGFWECTVSFIVNKTRHELKQLQRASKISGKTWSWLYKLRSGDRFDLALSQDFNFVSLPTAKAFQSAVVQLARYALQLAGTVCQFPYGRFHYGEAFGIASLDVALLQFFDEQHILGAILGE